LIPNRAYKRKNLQAVCHAPRPARRMSMRGQKNEDPQRRSVPELARRRAAPVRSSFSQETEHAESGHTHQTADSGRPASATPGNTSRPAAPADSRVTAEQGDREMTRRRANAPAINPLQGAAGQATLWTQSFRTPARPPLRGPASADVCIVGAGIAGLSVAFELQESGVSVIVLDDGAIGSGMTSRTTAHLASAIDDRLSEIERMHGADVMKAAALSHEAAIAEIERVVVQERISCDFEHVPGYLFLPEDGKLELLDRELDAAQRAGLGVRREERIPLTDFDSGPCNRFDRQAAFHPLKYLAGLVDAIERRGGVIHPTTHVDDWKEGRSVQIHTSDGHTVTAGSVVFATNVPINDRLVIHTKQAPYLTHVIVARIPKGSVPRALYWDMADPYHYVRLASAWRDEDRGTEFLIVGGGDYKTGQGGEGEPFASYARLEEWARQRFHGMREVTMRWSGQVMEPVDGLAFIGRNPMDHDNVYVVTGDSGMGITHGAIAGMLIHDLILGRENAWTSIYDPSRKATGAPLAYARENLNVAAQFFKSLTKRDAASPDEIGRDSGAIVRRGLSSVAAYRDLAGELHEMSARCPHLGCLVDWNPAERTWDCPCHGSRFDAIGKVISGPANTGLSPIESHDAGAQASSSKSEGA
jgi:glycine/D-amino acid oxidase-like deaminating enzyme/nitrite reductase/ring-hydroxylating ferredoxin subunit